MGVLKLVLSAGFWFSFSAVAVIFISITNSQKPGEKNHSAGHRILRVLKQWLRLQLLISIFLLPLSLFMFQQVSLVSPLANLLLIPYVSFLVVPLVQISMVEKSLLVMLPHTKMFTEADSVDAFVSLSETTINSFPG